jgi:N-acetylglucosamine malate deacetylase 2
MKILAVLAHPDDEAFAMAGTLKLLTQAGHEVVFLETTDGGAGQLHSSLQPLLKKMGSVAAIRKSELKASAKILGIVRIHHLYHPDGELNNKDIFDDILVKEIKNIVKNEKPELVLAYDHTGLSWHLDHIATSLATAKAVYELREIVKALALVVLSPENKLENYPYITMWGSSPTHVVGISGVADIKKQAIMAHQSQRKDWERFFKRQNNPGLSKEYWQAGKGAEDFIAKNLGTIWKRI